MNYTLPPTMYLVTETSRGFYQWTGYFCTLEEAERCKAFGDAGQQSHISYTITTKPNPMRVSR